VVNLPELAKPITGHEATGMCSGWTIRGEREQRVWKAKSETWEIPYGGQNGGIIVINNRSGLTPLGNE
jgi:hypothetical protein